MGFGWKTLTIWRQKASSSAGPLPDRDPGQFCLVMPPSLLPDLVPEEPLMSTSQLRKGSHLECLDIGNTIHRYCIGAVNMGVEFETICRNVFTWGTWVTFVQPFLKTTAYHSTILSPRDKEMSHI